LHKVKNNKKGSHGHQGKNRAILQDVEHKPVYKERIDACIDMLYMEHSSP
jgi:hypothetical protein